MGTPMFAVPILKSLYQNGFPVSVVYTQPPKRSNRGQKFNKSPIQNIAETLNKGEILRMFTTAHQAATVIQAHMRGRMGRRRFKMEMENEAAGGGRGVRQRRGTRPPLRHRRASGTSWPPPGSADALCPPCTRTECSTPHSRRSEQIARCHQFPGRCRRSSRTGSRACTCAGAAGTGIGRPAPERSPGARPRRPRSRGTARGSRARRPLRTPRAPSE